MPEKIIIDTDPGIDDAMAIFFALRSPELDVIGLTTVFGNVDTDLTTTNALRLLEIAGREDIPVARGASDPLSGPHGKLAAFVHGDDGQGNLNLPPPRSKPVAQPAASFIVDQVMRAPGEITLVPIGPLTNIALALRLEPRIANNVRRVVFMGGNAYCAGNASPAAEANCFGDPEAADLVLGAAWDVTMVGLDVTHKVNMTAADIARYAAEGDNPLAQHVTRILPFYQAFNESHVPGLDGIYVHDSSAIAYLIDPSLFTTVRQPVRVETQSLSRGKTWPAVTSGNQPYPPAWDRRPLVNICVDVKGPGVVALEHQRMTKDGARA